MEKKTEKAENVVFINKAKDAPDTVDNYSIVVDGAQYRAYPNPIFELKDKESGKVTARAQRTEPTEGKGLEKYRITVFDENGKEEAKFVAVQRWNNKEGKANKEWFNVSNPITYDEATGKPQVSWPEAAKEGETVEKNMMKLSETKSGGLGMGLTIQDQNIGYGFKVSDGSVYKVTPKGEKNELIPDATFLISPTKDGKRETFKLNLPGAEEPISFIRKNGQGAYQRMDPSYSKKAEKAAEATEVEAEVAEAAEAAAPEAEAPKKRGRFKK